MRIAVDAMGGDYAPQEIVAGTLDAARAIDAEMVLVGDEGEINECLAKVVGAALRVGDADAADISRVTVQHSDGLIDMDESPRDVLRRGRSSSLADCVEMVKCGEAEGAVSAGNSGAMMALGHTRLGTIPQISRPAIAVVLPTTCGKAILLDAGANADCKPEHLVEFALMGSCYAEHVVGVDSPRVATLNIGSEAKKGNVLTKAAHSLLETAPINYVGHVEGNSILTGEVDVIVADGFAGNVVLKVVEGAIRFMMDTMKTGIAESTRAQLGALLMKPVFAKMRRRCNWAEYGGAVLLGIEGVCVVGHGRSDRKAVRNAIQVAAEAAEHDIVEHLRRSVQQLS
jgi:phosphate acyltransferase